MLSEEKLKALYDLSDHTIIESNKTLDEKKLKTHLSKHERELREMNKQGSTMQMYDFYIRMKDQYA